MVHRSAADIFRARDMGKGWLERRLILAGFTWHAMKSVPISHYERVSCFAELSRAMRRDFQGKE